MKISERDVTYIVLSDYLLTFIVRYPPNWKWASPIRHKIDDTQINLIQLKTLEFELDFA